LSIEFDFLNYGVLCLGKVDYTRPHGILLGFAQTQVNFFFVKEIQQKGSGANEKKGYIDAIHELCVWLDPDWLECSRHWWAKEY
jgi:hypothetical protein